MGCDELVRVESVIVDESGNIIKSDLDRVDGVSKGE